LFAAFLSAFLLFTITQLQPNSTDISKDILLHISLQLSNSSVLPYVEPQFTVPSNVTTVNILLFASLALVLVDAFLAMLTKSWLRDFDRSCRSSNANVPEERARTREMRFQGMERWKLAEVVTLLPLLIQASLVLFQVALLILLFNLHRPTAYSTLVIFAAGVCFYVFTTVVSTFDTNAPFTSPLSRTLQALLGQSRSLLGQFRSLWVPSTILSRLKWHPITDGAMVTLRPVEGAEIHCAISTRLYTATSKAVENLPVFTELFDQWVHAPSLRLRSVSDWHEILPLVQPYLLSASPSNNFDPLPVARLFLCSDSKEFLKGREAIIASLGGDSVDTRESPTIERLYIRLLRPPGPDWSLAGQVVRKLNADRGTIIELQWILKWITFRYLFQSKGLRNDDHLSWVSNIRNIIPFLRSTAVYIIQYRLVNDDHELFNSLLLITRAIADASKEADESHPIQKLTESSENIHEGLFLPTGDLIVPPKRQCDFIRDLYTASSTSAAGFKREFTQLVILLVIGTFSAVDDSGTIGGLPFIDPEKDLAVLMDALWETWQAPEVNHHLLTGIAVCLLEQTSGDPLPDGQQRRFQRLLNAYDPYTRGATRLMNSSALLLIEAALSFSLKTGKASDGDSKWEPQTLKLENPWLVMHIHNILGHDWRIPGSAMVEAHQGQLEWCKDDRRDALDKLDRLGALDALDTLDALDALEWREWREWRAWRVRLDWLEWLEGLERLLEGLLERLLRPLEGLGELVREEVPELLREELREVLEAREGLCELDCEVELRELWELRKLREVRELRERREVRLLLSLLLQRREWRRRRWRGRGLSEGRKVREGVLERRRRDWLEQWHKWCPEQSPTALEIVATSRLKLYNDKVLPPDPVALGLFLSPAKKDIFNDSRRFILQFFGSTSSSPSLLPPNATEQEADPATARKRCSDFFGSKAIGEVTKWRLLTSVVFPEWETLSTQWKDLLATKVMKMDWLARVTPLLAGTFKLYEFGLSEDDCTYGDLTPTHLHMVATVAEYLGAERLPYEKARGLEEFLGQYSNISHGEDALRRIQTVITQVMQPDPLEFLAVLFGDQT
jgi:hypothetical protein